MSAGEPKIHAVNGVELCVQTFGDPGDPAMLLIGGRSASMDWWETEFCQRLAAGRRYVIRYDLRDTGRSTTYPAGAPDYTFADLVADAVGLLDAFGVGRAHVVGISMGGAIAQCLAVGTPDRVASLTLIDTTFALDDGPDGLPGIDPELAAFFESAAERPAPDWSDRAAVVEMLVEEQRALMRGEIDEARLRAVAGSVVDRSVDLAAMANHGLLESGPTPAGRLVDIAAPTLVVHGARDPLFPLPHGEALAAAVPQAALLVLPGVGHEAPPARTWDVVVPALVRHTSGDYVPAEVVILVRAEAEEDKYGWFEELYAAGAAGAAPMPWSRTAPAPLLVGWATNRGIRGPGRAAVVGCALGADAEYLASLGFEVTGFDISATAIRSATERNHRSGVEYRTADLLALPPDWRGAFDLVVENITVQALPEDIRPGAIAGVRGLVAPGGTLLVIALRDDGAAPLPPPPPWPLSRAEIDSFATDGLGIVSVEETSSPNGPRWRAELLSSIANPAGLH